VTRVNRKKGRLTPIEIIFILVVLVFAITVGIGGFMEAKADNNNKNPRQGRVEVADYIYKLCDEKNLIYIYRGEGIFVTPNSRQCN
jgi:flagellar basal body-associated protein FliL